MLTLLVLKSLRLLINMAEITMTSQTRDGNNLIEANNKMRADINNYLDKIKPTGPYTLVNDALVCIEGHDWPPMLKDNHAGPKTMRLVVDALNFYHLYGREK
jgi:hypothetical protein